MRKIKIKNGVKESRLFGFKKGNVILTTKSMLFNDLTVTVRGGKVLVYNIKTKKFLRPQKSNYYTKTSKTYQLIYENDSTSNKECAAKETMQDSKTKESTNTKKLGLKKSTYKKTNSKRQTITKQKGEVRPNKDIQKNIQVQVCQGLETSPSLRVSQYIHIKEDVKRTIIKKKRTAHQYQMCITLIL